jgi:parallel beta-helix repeat protein
VWTWGDNDHGQLGIDSRVPWNTPVRADMVEGIQRIACGLNGTLALNQAGDLYVWGDNEDGQLNTYRRYTDELVPALARELTSVDAVSAGGGHVVALCDGTVWTVGNNYYGQLGNGTLESSIHPVEVAGMPHIVQIAAGGAFCLALDEHGDVWSWGANSVAQLGTGYVADDEDPEWMKRETTPRQILTNVTVTVIAAGTNHALAIDVDGAVWAWGSNAHGQIGPLARGAVATPTVIGGLQPADAVAAGANHSLVLTLTGAVFALGSDTYGQLGNGPGGPGGGNAVEVTGVSGVRAVACGSYHSLAVDGGGHVWTWGYNGAGQLGDGTFLNRDTPVRVGAFADVVTVAAGRYHSAIVSPTPGTPPAQPVALQASDGGYRDKVHLTWEAVQGATTYAVFRSVSGDAGDAVAVLESITDLWADDTGADADVVYTYWVEARNASGAGPLSEPDTGSRSSAQLDGTVWGWGANWAGQLGVGTTGIEGSPVQMNGIVNAADVSAGQAYSLILCMDGSVWSCGVNGAGVLGDGTTASRREPVRVLTPTDMVAVSAGIGHALALRADGSVWAWGINDRGQLGPGTANDEEHAPVRVEGIDDVIAVAAGYRFSAAVRRDGTLWTWGANEAGQLGDNTTASRSTPAPVPRLDRVIGISVTGDDNSPNPGDAGHCVALLSDGSVLTWGRNNYGQLGFGTNDDAHEPQLLGTLPEATWVATGGGNTAFSLAALADGSVRAWGQNWHGELGNGRYGNERHQNEPVHTRGLAGTVAVSAGATHALALAADGSVWTWGSNSDRRIGVGDQDPDSIYPVPVPVSDIAAACAVSASATHSLAVWGSPGQVPARVSDLAAGEGTYTDRVRLTWRPVAGAASYEIWRSDSSSRQTVCIGSTNGACGYEDRNAPAGPLTYEVRAVNGAGAGAFSDPATGFRAVHTPDAVSGLAATDAASYDAVDLEWAPAFGASHYRVIRRPADDSGAAAVIADGVTGTEFSDTTADPGIVYRYWIQAVSAYGASPPGEPDTGERRSLGFGPRIWAWGSNSYGQQGNHSAASRRALPGLVHTLTDVAALAVGDYHCLAIQVDGTVWAWGRNAYGELGDGTTDDRAAPVRVPGVAGAIAVAAGDYHSYALMPDGTVWAWGQNWQGQLGDGTSDERHTPAPVKNLVDIQAVAAGQRHSLALSKDGRVWAWGANWNGRVGDGTTDHRYEPVELTGLPTVVAVAAGSAHSLVLDTNGQIWAWGRNSSGQLGDGTVEERHVPVHVSARTVFGAIGAGAEHSLAIADGSAWAWGNNQYRQVTAAVEGNVVDPTPLSGTTGAEAVCGGARHSAMLTASGEVVTWGGNRQGELGDGTTDDRAARLAAVVPVPAAAVAAGGYQTLCIAGSPEAAPASGPPVEASDEGDFPGFVRVEWTDAPGATHFDVLRSHDDNPQHAQLLVEDLQTDRYDDHQSDAGTTYWYWVRARNRIGTGPVGIPDSGVWTAVAPPAPTSIAASDGSYGDMIKVTWRGHVLAAGYDVWRSTGEAAHYADRIARDVRESDAYGTFEFRDNNCEVDTVYRYWVTAVNAYGSSPFSSPDTGYLYGFQSGTAYYVNDASSENDQICTAPGSAGNDGLSPGAPKASVQDVLDTYVVGPHDMIQIDTGVYALTADIVVTAADDGTRSDRRVRIVGSTHPDGSVFDRGDPSEETAAFRLEGANYVELRSLVIRNAGVGVVNSGGRFPFLNALDIGGCGAGIFLDDTQQARIEGCRLHGNTVGARISGRLDQRFIGNRIDNNEGSGLFFSGVLDGIVEGNTISDNGGHGVHLEDCISMDIASNLIWRNAGSGVNNHYSSVQVVGNTIARNGLGGGAEAFEVYTHDGPLIIDVADIHLRNNIIWADGPAAIGIAASAVHLPSSDYNLFFTTNSAAVGRRPTRGRYILLTSLGEWQAFTLQDLHSAARDPLFADPGNGDFHLMSRAGRLNPTTGAWVQDAVTSPAIDLGRPEDDAELEPAPNGNRRNLGAYGNTGEASHTPDRFLHISAPNGSQRWYAGWHTIRWSHTGGGWGAAGSLRLDYSVDGGASWSPVASGVPVSDSAFRWAVPGISPPTREFLVRATCEQDAQVVALSEPTEAGLGFTYYVNDSTTDGDVFCTAVGDGANDGMSPASPKSDLQDLLDTYPIRPGDTIAVDAGSYTISDPVFIESYDEGSGLAPVRVMGAPTPGATVFERHARTTGSVLVMQNCSHVYLQDLTVRGGFYGIYLLNTNRCRLIRCEATDAQYGLYLVNADDTVIDGCNVYANVLRGVHAMESFDPFLTDSRIADNGSEGVYLENGSGASFQNCVVSGNGMQGLMCFRHAYATFEGNLVHDNGGTGIDVFDADGSIVTGNTVARNGSSGVRLDGSGVLKSNIVWADGVSSSRDGRSAPRRCIGNFRSAGTIVADFNCFHITDGAVIGYADGDYRTTVEEWRDATGLDANSIQDDPLFADSGAGDFHLLSAAGRYVPDAGTDRGWITTDTQTSPCIDAGDPDAAVGTEPIPNGLRVNLGAYGAGPQASKSPATVSVSLTIVPVPADAPVWVEINGVVRNLPVTVSGEQGAVTKLSAPATVVPAERTDTTYAFTRWSDGTIAGRRDVELTGNGSLGAEFTPLHRITVQVNPAGADAAGCTAGLADSGTVEGWIAQGTDVTLRASPAAGWALQEWENGWALPTRPFTVSAPVAAAAAFRELPWVMVLLREGWNLVAFPMTPEPANPARLFAAMRAHRMQISGRAGGWNASRQTYEAVDEIEAGRGYWF